MQNRQGSPPSKRSRKGDVQPSRVLYISKLNPSASENDLHDTFDDFGYLSYVMCMEPAKQMALVEFEDLASAEKCINSVSGGVIDIAGQPAQLQFSTFEAIKRNKLESNSPTKILSISVNNVKYPIDASIIKKICAPYGEVIRVAMIRKAMLRALVELGTIDEALKTKRALNGADIYADCCTLKVEFSNIGHVEVTKCDDDHFQAEDLGHFRNFGQNDKISERVLTADISGSRFGTEGSHNQDSLQKGIRFSDPVHDAFGNSGFNAGGFRAMGFEDRGSFEFENNGRSNRGFPFRGRADYQFGSSRNTGGSDKDPRDSYARPTPEGNGFSREKNQDGFSNAGFGNSRGGIAGYETSGFPGRGTSQFERRGRGNRGMSDRGSRGRGAFQSKFDWSNGGADQRGRGYFRGQH